MTARLTAPVRKCIIEKGLVSLLIYYIKIFIMCQSCSSCRCSTQLQLQKAARGCSSCYLSLLFVCLSIYRQLCSVPCWLKCVRNTCAQLNVFTLESAGSARLPLAKGNVRNTIIFIHTLYLRRTMRGR